MTCGSAIPNPRPNKKHCSRPCAQRGYVRRWKRKNRAKVRSQKRRWQERHPGTFGQCYLSSCNGRILGAVLLEKGIGINNFPLYNGGRPERCECGSNRLICITDHEAFCVECGSRIMLARENEYYSMPLEPVCPSCGLVYQFPFFSVRGETSETKTTPCRREVAGKNQKHVPCDQAGRRVNQEL